MTDVGIDGNGGVQCALCLLEFPSLRMHNSEHVQSIKIPRVSSQNPSVDGFCIRKVATLVQGNRLIK
jgi:hypothetical protein